MEEMPLKRATRSRDEGGDFQSLVLPFRTLRHRCTQYTPSIYRRRDDLDLYVPLITKRVIGIVRATSMRQSQTKTWSAM